MEERYSDCKMCEQHADRIAALESTIAAKEAECERLRMDAERYRWLRDQKNDDGIVIAMKNKHIDDLLPYAVNIDRYIDAALAEEGK